jgi:flagellar biosynthesis protein FlhA
MPGKQMAIDADLNTGLIDEQEAKLRRSKISGRPTSYGSMDGAVKVLSKGDAIASIVITISTLWAASSSVLCRAA